VDMAKTVLTAVIPALENAEQWDNDFLFALLKEFAAAQELKAGAVMWIVRIAVSGMAVTPGGATELMTVLGKDEAVARLKTSLSRI